MKARKHRNRTALLGALALGLLVSSIASGQEVGQSGEPPRFEPKDARLALTIAVDKSSADLEQPLFLITLKNVGTNDVVVNLGWDLGNGHTFRPEYVQLLLTSPNGKTRELHFADKKHGGIAGTVADYLVPIRAGSTYTLKLSLNDFWCPSTSEHLIKLDKGESHVAARIVSPGWYYNRGSLMWIWRGSVKSALISVHNNTAKP